MAEQMRNGPRAQQEKMQKAEQERAALACPKHPFAKVITGPMIGTGRIATYCECCHGDVEPVDGESREERADG